MNNPIEMIKNMSINKNITNPVLKQLITKAQNGDSKGVEDFARNFLKEQGRDFDSEFAEFMKNFK